MVNEIGLASGRGAVQNQILRAVVLHFRELH